MADYLVARQVMPERLVLLGLGEIEPVPSNVTTKNRACNHRAEIRIVPLTLG